jgi:glycosyltransferase involved in cell wall biosynthesis
MNDSLFTLFIGPLPPPVQGISVINKDVCDQVRTRNIRLKVFNTAPPSCRKNILPSQLARFFIVLRAYVFFLLALPQAKNVYLSASGGLGRLYELLFIITARALMKRTYYHHHSYSYISRHSKVHAVICSLCSKSLCHIFLGSDMARKYCIKYGTIRYRVISNTAFIPYPERDVPCLPRPSLRDQYTFLHISNLTNEKGLSRFLSFARYAFQLQPSWRFHLAGPLLVTGEQSDVLDSIFKLPNMVYHGYVEREKKAALYKLCSFMIFPSLYFNEAEPLVVLDAMRHGCIPLVYDQGLMASMVGLDYCILPKSDDEFPANVIDAIALIETHGLSAVSLHMIHLFEAMKEQSILALDSLLTEIE